LVAKKIFNVSMKEERWGGNGSISKTLWKKQNFETHFHFNFYEPFKKLDHHPTLVLHQLLQTNETSNFNPPNQVTTQH
jgi:hypothetical protein